MNFPAIDDELNSHVLKFFYDKTKMAKRPSFVVECAQLYKQRGDTIIVKLFFERSQNQRNHMSLELRKSEILKINRSIKLNQLLDAD